MRNKHLSVLLLLIFIIHLTPAVSSALEPPAFVQPPAVSVSHPPEVGDGTAFLCAFRGGNMESVTVSFLKSSITAKPENSREDMPETAVLLPVPLDHADRPEQITWTAKLADGSTISGESTVRVIARTYPVQKLTVAPQYVTPDPSLKERIDRERKLMGAALNARSATRHWALPMLRPVPGEITSLYGLRRVFNGEPRAPHKGLDFRAPQGEPIAAIANGTIVLTGDFYYAGKFVVVDHGLGVVSISMHMSETLVEKNQRVKQGDILGLVGSTGRSTGAHLHLGVSVLGQSIDALSLIDLTEQDKAAYARPTRGASAAPVKKNAARGGKKNAGKSGAQSGKKTAANPTKHKTKTLGAEQKIQ